eukprot:1155902-Pelagomonas_calceolata.AAC.2
MLAVRQCIACLYVRAAAANQTTLEGGHCATPFLLGGRLHYKPVFLQGRLSCPSQCAERPTMLKKRKNENNNTWLPAAKPAALPDEYRHHSSRPRPLQAYNGYTDQGICGPDFSCINCFLGQTTGINKGAPCASSSINCCLKNGIWGKQVGALPGKNL